ncbi:MAG: serine/threonine-protein kinase [Myxococcota bacterium]
MNVEPKASMPGRIGQLATMRLPPELERAAARRLGNLAGGFAVIFLVAITLRSLVGLQSVVQIEYLGLANATTAVMAAMMLLLFRASRSQMPSWRILKLGLLFEILLCLGLALEEQVLIDFFEARPRLSFVVVVLLTFPLIVPTPWFRRVVVTLVCALTPMMVWPLSTMITGRDAPLPGKIVMSTVPLVVSSLFALYAARLAHQLRREVSAARQVGSYELIEELGSGAMGEVWRANHRLLARDAAVKLIRAEALGDDQEQAKARFEREARATASLRSPHTVALYDYGQTEEGTYYYAMELLQGLTLDELVRAHGPVPESRALYLLRQAAVSLAEAHGIDLVHRDVKPANLIVARVGIEFDFLKVLDFGLVKSTVHRPMDVQLTQEHSTTGTPAFMAPEVVLDEELDGRGDLYALGCVAVWLLSGQLVFDEVTPLKMMMAHAHQEPVPPSRRTELEVTPDVDALVLRCLEKSPAKRFQNASELVGAIDEAQERIQERWSQRDAERWWSLRIGSERALG